MKSALITGIAGQDGIYLGRYLAQMGYRVVGTVRSSAVAQPLMNAYLPQSVVYEIDMRDSEALGSLIARERPDEIYNLASWSSVGRSWSDPETVTAVNGLAVLGLLEQLRVLRDSENYNPKVCQASSSEMFGLVKELPQTEDSPHHPRSPYAVAKSFAHHTAINYRESYGMYVSTPILFNHESPLRPNSFVTRKITQAAARIAAGISETVSLGRTDVRRDWGAAADYVEALHLVLQQDEPTSLCIATGVSHSLDDFISSAFLAAGVQDFEARVISDPGLFRPADVPETCGDPSTAKRLLGWEPHHSFPRMIEEMVTSDTIRLQTGQENDVRYL